MARTTKPHPRSLDALFGPKVRTVPKKAVKRCLSGHRQEVRWQPGELCRECHRAVLEGPPRTLPPLGRTPAVLTHLIVSTRRIVSHAIPRHLQRRRVRR